MQSELREPVGFLCRWCLLVAAGATALGGVCVVGMAAKAATADAPGRIVAWDWIGGPSSRKYREALLRSLPVSAMVHLEFPPLIGLCPGNATVMAESSRWGFALRFPRRQPGLRHVRMVGVPYGLAAFRGDEALLHVVPPKSRVFLIDARLALAVPTDQRALWRDCLQEMQRRGHVAFFLCGPFPQYATAKAEIRRRYPNTPMLYVYGGGRRTVHAFGWIAQALYAKRSTRRMGLAHVVTGDPFVATAAALSYYVGHVLVPASPPSSDVSLPKLPPRRRPRRHASLLDLRDTLLLLPKNPQP